MRRPSLTKNKIEILNQGFLSIFQGYEKTEKNIKQKEWGRELNLGPLPH